MKKLNNRQFLIFRICLFFSISLLLLAGCQKTNDPRWDVVSGAKVIQKKAFNQVNLVASNAGYGDQVRIDNQMVNAWGLAFSGGGIAWIGSNESHVSNIFNSEGLLLRPAVNIPSPTGPTGGSPTGVVFTGSPTDFLLPGPNNQPARFIFVGTDGVLSAWNGAAGANAMLIKDNSANAVYTGLAIANNEGKSYIYAANFKSGHIDVWDKDFNPVWMPFKDKQIPWGYAPFNVQSIGDKIYVMYAKVGPDGDEVKGMGNGYVSIFYRNGIFYKRFASRGQLNAPWGVAKAPQNFFNSDLPQNTILVGNFGNGHINAFELDGTYIGELGKQHGAVEIDGLWAISFAPPTATAVDSTRLYFCAGPKGETQGLFGYLKNSLLK